MTWGIYSRQFALAASASILIDGGPRDLIVNKKKEMIVKKNEWKRQKARETIRKYMIQAGIPGLSIGVTVDGKTVYKGGFGYADVEANGLCTGDTIMRIASISKSITSTIAAMLVESGKLDINAPVQKYVTEFPLKKVDSKEVAITAKHLLCHMGGIRHYPEEKQENGKKKDIEDTANNNTKKKEFLLNEKFKSIEDAMKLFQNDPLVGEPGTKFYYTTHGFTLLAAVLEKASGKKFPSLVNELFYTLGMTHSSLDNNTNITINRTRYYYRNDKHMLENCPEVDNSCKWAGGGMQSTVGDMLKFANAILYSYQSSDVSVSPSPLISRSTLDQFWEAQVDAGRAKAALGWFRVEGGGSVGGVRGSRTFWYHTGAAVGASSVLLIAPNEEKKGKAPSPSGVSVAMLCNLQDASLLKLAMEIRDIFTEE